MSTPVTVNTVAQLLRPGTAPRTADVSAAERDHAATIVAHLLHEECQQWSWTEHHPETHRAEARRIVGALCREGWGPRPPVERANGPAGRPTGGRDARRADTPGAA